MDATDLMHEKKKRRKTSAKQKRAQHSFGAKMKKCGIKWRKRPEKWRAGHSWRAFIKKSCFAESRLESEAQPHTWGTP